MATRNDAKLQEGAKHLAAGDKCLKTGLFKWRPDFEGAAQSFKDAANCYRVARAHEQAKSAFMRASEAMANSNSLFHAAKAMEQAALMAKELKQGTEAGDLFERAGQMFRENGSIDTAGLMMDRAGKILEPLDPDRAISMFLAAAELSEDAEKIRQAVESQAKAIQLMVRYRRLDDCIVAMSAQLSYYNTLSNFQQMHKVVLSMVLVHLCREDFVAAQRVFQESCSIEGFADSDPGADSEDLLNAYDEGDVEKMQEVTRRQTFSFISTEIAKLARALRGPGDLAPPDARAASALSTTKGSLTSPRSPSSDDSTKDRAALFAKRTPGNLASDRAALLGEELPKKTAPPLSELSRKPSGSSQPTSSPGKGLQLNNDDERAALFADSKSKKEEKTVEEVPSPAAPTDDHPPSAEPSFEPSPELASEQPAAVPTEPPKDESNEGDEAGKMFDDLEEDDLR